MYRRFCCKMLKEGDGAGYVVLTGVRAEESRKRAAYDEVNVYSRRKEHSEHAHTRTIEEIEENALSPQDNAFMTELYQLMENELSNSELDVARMTEMMRISRTKFYYKVKGLTGENPSVFFKRYKLNRAAQLLQERKHNVSEIADMTGFSTLSHFSTSFKKQFGVSPSEYVK